MTIFICIQADITKLKIGTIVNAATVQEAKALSEPAPKVSYGYLTVKVFPWMAVTSEKMALAFQHLL